MISAVVPTLRGAARLARNLGSVVASLAAAGEAWEVVVVDDGGGDVGPLPAGARLVTAGATRGYGPAVNAGAASARGDHLLVLNDDVRLEVETVKRLRAAFPAPALFAAVPAIRSPLAACGDEGGKAGRWEAGFLEIREVPASRTHPTLYPVGCCFLCPRASFQELGGYDDLYAPFFWEDVDLGYRAWRRGLEVLHVPGAVCHHEGSATLSEQRTLSERERIGFRNRVLFHLRNLQAPALRGQCLGALAAVALFEADPDRRAGLSEALEAYVRSGPRDEGGLTDGEILERVPGA